MKKADLMEMALEKLVGDMDDLEGSSAIQHETDECPDPLTCTMHDAEHGEKLAPGDGGGKGVGVEIEVKKLGDGLPSMEGAAPESPAEDGLSDEDKEDLRKLLSK